MSDEAEAGMNEAADILRHRLETLRRRLDVLTAKPARAEVLRDIGRLQWQLGEISGEELQGIEAFADRFTYE